ncbi:aromatic ring-hydroxylating oxygenase subunit alpha [Caenimonas aquaedulcis]|uniref:Aromatic ring-hydroxylating dioxygenase subunit alpha n=1 Tax=Caenimonas aquaedulcis TaxID=2793270 RepID=A0A931MJ19_9BURK|nr:aromatic ring-hydroxylating dioxygenase subunit alpha [Caenimonas aquaedulcis]MBG9390439.1 aromatic ring-hydroxylating dioxygenase subunit alpha [Caenimonas aquaedulcis]
MNDPHIPAQIAQVDAINYQEILDLDTRPVPDFMRERRVPDLGTDAVPVAHYTSPEVFRKSIDKMWMKTWQLACREEQIPNVGDYVVYDVVGKSLIVVRSAPGEIRALHNSCLHRGRRLVSDNGHKGMFICPFHGMQWKLNGTFAHNPFQWDFPQCPESSMKLPEAKVGTWGGFVFVNFDLDARPLEEALGPIPAHFSRWNFKDKYIAAHIGKRAKCSYLVAFEAFMETHHAITTHPEILSYITTGNCQYDVLSELVCRHISARGYQSTEYKRKQFTQNEIATLMLQNSLRDKGAGESESGEITLPEGMTARAFIADMYRKQLAEQNGRSMDDVADFELGDSLIYSMYPNFQIWGGVMPNWVYRFRPGGTSHDECLMEFYLLRDVPAGAERPKPAKYHLLGDNEAWASSELGEGPGSVLDQDWSNMEQVQLGLEASATGVVQLGHYLEMKIRHHHQLLAKYLEE